MPSNDVVIRSAILATFRDLAERRGLDCHGLLEEAGLPKNALDNPETELPLNSVASLMELAAERADDPSLGLTLAEAHHPGASGLVDYIALRGYVVAPLLDASQIRQLLETRRLLELKAIELAFENWDDLVADLEPAQRHHAAVLERLESSTDLDFDLVREHFQADWAFHRTIAEHSGNRYISSSLDGLRTHTHRMRQSFDTLGHPHLDAKEAFAEHSLVHRSIMARQKDAAIDALSSHLDGVLERYLAQVEDPQGSDHS